MEVIAMKEPKNCWDFFDCKVKDNCVAYQNKQGANCWQTVAGVLRMRCIGADGRGIEDCTQCSWYKKQINVRDAFENEIDRNELI